jgi:GNAT superfamily N-acetyltransferase
MKFVRKATESDREICIETLVHAFNDDPVINWFVRQDRKRDTALELFFQIAFDRLTFPFGEAYIAGDGEGVALWTPPGKWQLSFTDQLWLIPDYIKAFKATRLHTVVPRIQNLQNLHPSFPHYYLFAAGVTPSAQGCGIGRAMLQHVLAECDGKGLPAYLEATTRRNRDLYERLGFRSTREFPLGKNGPTLWLMLRDPRRLKIM